jgi:hypothetical protein
MFFNKRKKFNGDVACLLPGFGIDLEKAGVFKVLHILDAAWENGFNKYEASLMVTYLYVADLYERSRANEANEIVSMRLNSIEADWLKKGIVSAENVSEFRKNAEGIWRKAQNKI